MKRELTIATCQFPVSGDIKRNASYILRQMAEAKEKGADVSHFSESSLSGYAGTDFKCYNGKDEALRLGSLEKIIQLSSELKIWVIVGSHHFDKNNHLPYNCLWLIDNRGKIINRYDKRFCTAADCDFSFSLHDVIVKWISGEYPVHEIILIRSCFAIIPILFIAHLEGGLHLLRTNHIGAHFIRSLIFFGRTFLSRIQL